MRDALTFRSCVPTFKFKTFHGFLQGVDRRYVCDVRGINSIYKKHTKFEFPYSHPTVTASILSKYYGGINKNIFTADWLLCQLNGVIK